MKAPRKNAFEWTVFAISAALIAGTAGVLLVHEWRKPDGPPDIRVEAAAARPVAGGFAVPVRIVNSGGRSAASVRIEAIADTGERAELVLPFAPVGTERGGEVTFSRSPGTVRVRVLGYEIP